MDLILDLLILAFFGRGELLVCHSELCRLVSESYSKIHDSSLFITCLKNVCHFRWAHEGPGTHSFSFHLFAGEVFWNQLCTNFPHAQFLGQNVLDGLVIQIQLTTDHSDCQTSIRSHQSTHFCHIFLRFLTCKVFQNEVSLSQCLGHRKMLYATKNLCPR